MKFILIICGMCIAGLTMGQSIQYSKPVSEDNSQISFEILGKIGANILVYKNVRWKHMLAIYNSNMELVENSRMTFIPDRTFNVDFVVYPSYFYIIYQYQRNSTIWCKAVKMSSAGRKLSEPVVLDTSRLGLLADKKIYTTTASENKNRILLYKLIRKNDELTLVTKLYNPELVMLDSTRQQLHFDIRHDVYSDLYLANSGTYVFTKAYKNNWTNNIRGLQVISREPGSIAGKEVPVPLQGKFVDEVKLKIDNLNNNYILNSLYSKSETGNIEGLFSAIVGTDSSTRLQTAFNTFDDSLRVKFNAGGRLSEAFDNLFLRNTVVKRNGGFILAAEGFYSQASNNPGGYRRFDNLYNSPYSSEYSYYMNSPSYNGFYRPYVNNFTQTIRYFYDNILILSLDSSLQLKWNKIIYKKQADDEQDNFMSFTNLNDGGEIHFLFNDDKGKVVMNQSIIPGGEVKRYPTLKSHEINLEFMPKLGRQVSATEVIMPFLYRGGISFAKIDFVN